MSEAVGPFEVGRIVVFGGGVYAWLAALACARRSAPGRCETLVVETPAERTLAVGEATPAGFLPLLAGLGLDPRAFLQRCSASPRLATRYDDWIEAGSTHWTPCSSDEPSPRTTRWLGHLAHLHRAGLRTADLADLSPHVRLCRGGTVPTARALAALAPGFHFDAESLTQLAREAAAARGVRQLFGTVAAVACDAATGAIARVGIGGGREVAADLFVDATANGAVAGAMGNRWIGWPDILCDRLVGLPLPRDPAQSRFTTTTAVSAGHIWRLPLAHRTGLGYSYSSAHTSDDEATEALVAAAGLSRRRTADPRRLAFEPGRRTSAWRHNCLCVGAAACRLDPVLAPEGHIVQAGLDALRRALDGDARTPSARRAAYNASMDIAIDAARDATRLPFATSARTEPFWEAARRLPLPATLAERLEAYATGGVGVSLADACTLAATGRFPRAALAAQDDLAEIETAFARETAATDALIATWQE